MAISVVPASAVSALSGGDWNAGKIIDDNLFYRDSEFTPSQIQDFLNARVPVCDTNGTQPYAGTTRAAYSASKGYPAPFTCLRDFNQTIGGLPGDAYCAGVPSGNFSAASIIYIVSNVCGISAKALIVLLEKEQGLVSDDWPWSLQYRSATGYGCPDTAACDSQYYGFFNQVYRAARQFKLYKASPNSYRYKPFQTNAISYNPSASCGSSNVYIQNYATAGLYNYTPYQPNASALANLTGTGDSCGAYGNRNFWRLFNNWFGSTISDYAACKEDNNIAASYNGNRIVNFKYNNANTLAFTSSNNTGSGCAEVHPWSQNNYNSWATHIMTSQPSFDGVDGKLMTLDDGGASSRLVLVKTVGTAGGKVEFHEWEKNYAKWKSHIVTDLPAADLASNGILLSAGNCIVYVKYKNTSYGKIEAHVFSPSLNGWIAHIVSNQPTSEMVDGTIIAKGDKLVYMKYNNTPGGKIEFHEWADGLQAWTSHITSNQPAIELNHGWIMNRGNKLVYVKRAPGSNNIEFHEWADGYQAWNLHASSNLTVSTAPEALYNW